MENTTLHNNVYVDYLMEVGKWVIVDGETDDLVKSYSSEADCMFDYAAIRNKEASIDDIKQNRDYVRRNELGI